MKSLVFSGYYGMSNYGDDLFGVVSAWGARKWWPEYQAEILGPRMVGQHERFAIPNFISTELYGAGSTVGKLIRTSFSVKALLTSDRFIFSGGSLFSSNRSKIMDVAEKISNLTGRRLSAIGVSVGPFVDKESSAAVAKFLRRFEYISVRDQVSYDLLRDFDPEGRVSLARDLAGIMPNLIESTEKAAHNRHLIGYAPCNILGEPGKADAFDQAFVRSLKGKGVTVRLFSLNSHAEHGDSQRCARVAERLGAAAIPYEFIEYASRGVSQTWAAIGQCDAFVSVRLHGAITAYLTGVPFILFEYHRKCTDFLDDIQQPASRRQQAGAEEQLSGQIDELLSPSQAPGLAPSVYSTESCAHFTQAPWAKIS